MILLLGKYLKDKENFNTDEIPEVDNTTRMMVFLYMFLCISAFILSFYLNWQDNQPTSVCLLCAMYAGGLGIFYFIFIGIYYTTYYSKHTYRYVEFSKEFNTTTLSKLDVIAFENCVKSALPNP